MPGGLKELLGLLDKRILEVTTDWCLLSRMKKNRRDFGPIFCNDLLGHFRVTNYESFEGDDNYRLIKVNI